MSATNKRSTDFRYSCFIGISYKYPGDLRLFERPLKKKEFYLPLTPICTLLGNYGSWDPAVETGLLIRKTQYSFRSPWNLGEVNTWQDTTNEIAMTFTKHKYTPPYPLPSTPTTYPSHSNLSLHIYVHTICDHTQSLSPGTQPHATSSPTHR